MHKKRFQHAQSCWETSRKHIFTRYCISIKYWPKLPHFKGLILGFTECPSSAAATCIIAQGFIYMIKLFILQRRKTENALKSCHRISMMLYTHRTSSITYWIIEFQDRSRFALWPWPEISFIALLDFLSFLHVYIHLHEKLIRLTWPFVWLLSVYRGQSVLCHTLYCLSKNSWPNLHCNLLYKMGPDFLDIQNRLFNFIS